MKVISRLFILVVSLNSLFLSVPTGAMELQVGEEQPVPAVQRHELNDGNPAEPEVGDPDEGNAEEGDEQPAQLQAIPEAENACSICLEDMDDKDEPEITQLACGHEFCTDCIVAIEEHPADAQANNVFARTFSHFKCPICRAVLSRADIATIKENYYQLHPERNRGINKYKIIKGLTTLAALGLMGYGAYHMWYEKLPVDGSQLKTTAQQYKSVIWNAYKTGVSCLYSYYIGISFNLTHMINAAVDGLVDHVNISVKKSPNLNLYKDQAFSIYNLFRRVIAIYGHIYFIAGLRNIINDYTQRASAAQGVPVPPMLR